MKKIISMLLAISMIATLGLRAFAQDELSITLTIDNPNMNVNGVSQEIDPGKGTVPVIRNDRTLLPVRAVVEAMGGNVGWDDATRKVTLKKGEDTILLTIDDATAYLNDEAKVLDTTPVIINDRTMLPIRFIAESFGFTVGWDEATRTVSINLLKDNQAYNSKYSDAVLEKVYNATMLLGKDTEYNQTANITYGQLSKAGVTVYMNEDVSNYAGLNVDDTKLIEHEYAKEYYVVGRDVLGTEKAVDGNATVGDAIDVLTYYLAKRNDNKVTFKKDDLLKGLDRNSLINHKQFASLVAELDDIAPILVKIELTAGGKQTNVPTKLEKDVAKYPSNSADYRAILSEIPQQIYTIDYDIPASVKTKPVDNYNFSRDFRDIFIDILAPWIDSAKEAGVEMKMSYYPSLCADVGNGYRMRVKIDIISMKDGTTIGDLFVATDGSRPDIAISSSFYCDLDNNLPIESVSMPSDTLTIYGYYPVQ